MNLGLLVVLENADKVLSNIQQIFNTGPYGDPPLKIRASSCFKLAKISPSEKDVWTKINPISSRFLTLDHMGTSLKNQNFQNRPSSCFKLAKIKSRVKIS